MPRCGNFMRSFLALIGWLGVTFLAPLCGTLAVADAGAYYASLTRPEWSPPGWIFGPVWTALYSLMAVAAWLVWRRGGWREQRFALSLYLFQLVLNAFWTPLFFGLRRPDFALAEIIFLWCAIAATLIAFSKKQRLAASLLAPYLAWVSFATALNFQLWRLNP